MLKNTIWMAPWLAAAMAVYGAAGCIVTTEVEPETPTVESTRVDVFHDELAPYGVWIDTPDGPVWQPDASEVGDDFVPYATGGAWAYTDWGWTFEADWAWGWAAFHYGRWYVLPHHGWVWRPDTIWGPAWVDWRVGGGYVGWVPLPPPGVAVEARGWTFVDTRDFLRHDVRRYAVPGARVGAALFATSPVSGPRVEAGERGIGGPSVTHVYRATGTEVPMRHIHPPPKGVVRFHPHTGGGGLHGGGHGGRR